MSAYKLYVDSNDDPTIFFHVSGGAKIHLIADQFRPEDTANLGCAVLISYEVTQSPRHRQHPCSPGMQMQDSQYLENGNEVSILMEKILSEISDIIQEEVSPLYGEIRRVPLMNILDSMGMQQLRSRIQELLGNELPVSFLFQHPTLDCIQKFISGETKISVQSGTQYINHY